MPRTQNPHKIKERAPPYSSPQSCSNEILDASCNNIAKQQQQQQQQQSTKDNSTSISSKLSINNLLCTPQDIKRIIFNDLTEYLKTLPDSPSISYRQLLEFLVKLHKDIPMEIREDIHFFLEEQLALREQKMRIIAEAHDHQQLEENPHFMQQHSANACEGNVPRDHKRAM